jgi:hypothetical protein
MKQKITKQKDKNVYEILYNKKLYKIEEYFKPREITPYEPLKHNQVVLMKFVPNVTYPNGGYFWQVLAFNNTIEAKQYLKNKSEEI